MSHPANQFEVYLEIGSKKTFAGAVGWPGWSRGGWDETAALQALLESGPRYARALHAAGLEFNAPGDVAAFTVIERLPGTSTTDFGAPDVAPSTDDSPVDEDQLQFFQQLLQACWEAFDVAVQAAAGKELRKGPRGGGRDVQGIARHVLGAEAGYLSRLGWKFKWDEKNDPFEQLQRAREAVLQALGPAARGELPTAGPRGGKRWTPRYYVRRAAWHILDHAWEIEDRIV